MTLWSAYDRAMYSAIVVEVVTLVCNLDAQMMGKPSYMIIQPKRDLAMDGSVLEMSGTSLHDNWHQQNTQNSWRYQA